MTPTAKERAYTLLAKLDSIAVSCDRHEYGLPIDEPKYSEELRQTVIAELDAAYQQGLAAAPQWQDRPPTKAGWYWWRAKDGMPEIIIEVLGESPDLRSYSCGVERFMSPAERRGEWCGPISPPAPSA